MKYNDLITPVGTKDSLFTESEIKEKVKKGIYNCFELAGYKQISTPGIEFYDVFEQNSHYFPQEKLYKFTDNQNRLLVLRPDSTVPIARVVATRLKNAPLPLRIFYDQPVYRYVPELKGRSVQTCQMGIEMIGSTSELSDMEVAGLAAKALESTGENYIIEIGHSAIVGELINELSCSDDKKEEIRAFIDSKNYPMLSDSLKEVGTGKISDALKELPTLFGGREVFEKARKLLNIPKINDVIDELEEIYEKLLKVVPRQNLTVDLGMANKIDYYTGIIFKGYMDGYGSEVMSGGRYDKLLAEFGYDVPAIGFAVNVDAVCRIKSGKGILDHKTSDILVHPEKGCELKAFEVAESYRKKGYITEISMFDEKSEAMNYAKEMGIAKVIITDGES